MDQWVKIPFLPNEYWFWKLLSTLMGGIGTLIKLDKYTLQNDEKAQFARVCVNIDITKPVPCSLSLTSEEDTMDFFLSYEGVHEVCPLCGAKDHSLVSCPRKPKNTMELVVAQFEASNLDTSNLAPNSSDWIHVKPQRRARPRVFQGSTRPRRGSFKGLLSRLPPPPCPFFISCSYC